MWLLWTLPIVAFHVPGSVQERCLDRCQSAVIVKIAHGNREARCTVVDLVKPRFKLHPKIAAVVKQYAHKYKIDTRLITALIYRESRGKVRARSGKNFGLMQVRVSRTTNPKYLGKEWRVFDVRTNIKLGTRLLNIWRNYHQRNCHGGDHWWWSHYQWGKVVRNSGSGDRVLIQYARYLVGGSVVCRIANL